jgi:DtxR family Mn-dependent transcriptional regulator
MGNISLVYVILFLFFTIIFLLFMPGIGLLHLWRKSKETSNRILIENALKYIQGCEYKNLTCSQRNLAESLSIKAKKASDLIENLQSQKLIMINEKEIRLSYKGRLYALQIIRTHRLWERHLADDTSVNEIKWHIEAEKKEHFLSKDETDKLAAKLGQPLFDPHGDPIPSETGYLPEDKGIEITNLKEGHKAKIIHLEDEPEYVYTQLIKRGLQLGQTFEVIKKSSDEIIINTNIGHISIIPELYSNISVKKLSQIESPETLGLKTLADLKSGDKGTVKMLSKKCRGQQRRRLMDLGILPGTEISVDMISPTGDPTAYNVRDTVIALRKQQAEKVFIHKFSDDKKSKNKESIKWK